VKVWNILAIIMGVALIALGIWCIVTPVATYLALAWILGLGMVVDGIANIFAWNELRKADMANAWTMVGAIISIILGAIVLVSWGAQLAVDLFIVVMAAIWLIAMGVTRIVAGIRLRSIHTKGGVENIGKRWFLTVILGLLMAIVGILSLFEPVVLMFGIGVFMGGCIIVAGVSAIGLATS